MLRERSVAARTVRMKVMMVLNGDRKLCAHAHYMYQHGTYMMCVSFSHDGRTGGQSVESRAGVDMDAQTKGTGVVPTVYLLYYVARSS